MIINNVIITNWTDPGTEYWNNVKKKPFESLIEATFEMTLTWEEYNKLLEQAKGKITIKL